MRCLLLRWLGHGAAAVSLLLGMGLIGLWVQGQFKSRGWESERWVGAREEWGYCWIATGRSRAGVGFGRVQFPPGLIGSWSCCGGNASFEHLTGKWTEVKDAEALLPPAVHWRDRLIYVRSQRKQEVVGHQPKVVVDELDATVVAPYWVLMLLLLTGPGLWAVAWRRRAKRSREGRCRSCGYDLRATPGRCPECGMTRQRPEQKPHKARRLVSRPAVYFPQAANGTFPD